MNRLTPARAYVAALVLLVLGLVAIIVASGMPWLLLAVALGVVATRGWGRVVVGVLIAVAGIVAILVSVLGMSSGPVPLGALGGILLVVGGVWTAVAGRTWPAMGARYDAGRPASRRVRALSPWEAQDRGIDPTADPSD